uniref:Cadherin N-terminal domain-containing protein n=2 Tax=Poecilia mexicana TaxID=48701 RepID=A0A3B3X5L1_9TELE
MSHTRFAMREGRQRRRLSCWWFAGIFLLCSVDMILGQLKYSVSEHVRVGSVVGNVGKDLGLDLSTLTSRRFRIVSNSNHSLFE